MKIRTICAALLCVAGLALGPNPAHAQFNGHNTNDDLGIDLELPIGKHRVYGVGPELTVPIATKKKLIGFLNARYLWETGARSTLEGSPFVFTATFPIPSVPLQ